jgi:mannitol-specific phosphotransferase system IIBC component
VNYQDPFAPQQPPPEPLPSRVCPKCSTQSFTSGNFCPHCGASYVKRTGASKRTKLTVLAAVIVVLLAAGAVAGLVLKNSHDKSIAKHKQQAAASSSAAAASESRAAASSAAADAKRIQDDATRADRKSLVKALEASVTKDAKKDVSDGLLDGPIKHTQCDPANGTSDLLRASNTFQCTAVTKVSSDGTESGYVFSATVNWSAESYSWHLGR